MPGTTATYLKAGSRSEILAQYVFASWGAVTPALRSDDYGIDLFCTLSESIGARSFVREYLTVQVKSASVTSWVFKDGEEIKWLVEHPTPLFLTSVDKKNGAVCVYHVMPRFYLWALSALPDHLELVPGEGDDGKSAEWAAGQTFSLSAPIIRVTLEDMTNDDTMMRRKNVLGRWVAADRENCDLVRQGLLRFRMPHSYQTNEMPNAGTSEVGCAIPDTQFLERGLLRLAESAECIGGQLFRKNDRPGALRAALLVRHLIKTYPQVFEREARWSGTISGDMGMFVCPALNKAAGTSLNAYGGLDRISETVNSDSVASRFLNDGS